MSFCYIETTYEPPLNLSVPLDESSLEHCPAQNPPTLNSEDVSEESIIEDLNTYLKTVIDVQDKLSDCTLTKLDLMNASESTLYKLKEVKSKVPLLTSTYMDIDT